MIFLPLETYLIHITIDLVLVDCYLSQITSTGTTIDVIMVPVGPIF